MAETIISADMPLPPPLVRLGYCAEYKLMKLRECPLPDGNALDTPDRAFDFWMANVPTAQWFRDEQETFVVSTRLNPGSNRRRGVGKTRDTRQFESISDAHRLRIVLQRAAPGSTANGL